jgi:hypothetical protein
MRFWLSILYDLYRSRAGGQDRSHCSTSRSSAKARLKKALF